MINVFYASELTELLQNSHEELNQVSEDWSAQEEKRTENSQQEASLSQSEMDGSLKLIILCGVMLFGSYLAGSIPLFIAFSEEKLQVRVK